MYSKVKKGFTLIELLVVLSIVSLLSSIVMSSISTARMKARDAKRISDLRSISVALNMYADQNGRYPQAAPCAYDVSYCFILSYNTTNWNTFASSLAPYIKLPKDPINSNCDPWSTTTACYSYAYGNVGTGVVTASNINGVISYDLEARLETPNHPQTAQFTKPKYNFYKSTFPGVYSPQLYMPELR